jgi:UTP:GlnB (protein PII) uridylyltransferase
LLHALACAFAAARIEVFSATVTVEDRGVVDRFEVINQSGAKLTAAQEDRVRELIHSGVTPTRRRRLFARAFG